MSSTVDFFYGIGPVEIIDRDWVLQELKGLGYDGNWGDLSTAYRKLDWYDSILEYMNRKWGEGEIPVQTLWRPIHCTDWAFFLAIRETLQVIDDLPYIELPEPSHREIWNQTLRQECQRYKLPWRRPQFHIYFDEAPYDFCIFYGVLCSYYKPRPNKLSVFLDEEWAQTGDPVCMGVDANSDVGYYLGVRATRQRISWVRNHGSFDLPDLCDRSTWDRLLRARCEEFGLTWAVDCPPTEQERLIEKMGRGRLVLFPPQWLLIGEYGPGEGHPHMNTNNIPSIVVCLACGHSNSPGDLSCLHCRRQLSV